MKKQKKAEKKIRELGIMIRQMSVTPDTFSYVEMYQALQELYFQKEYKLVCDVCNTLLNRLSIQS